MIEGLFKQFKNCLELLADSFETILELGKVGA